MDTRLLDGLNAAQREAVLQTEGYVKVLAGPGTGKTRTLTHRCAWLISVLGISARAVLCVTFTNKAAGEMKKRILDLCGAVSAPLVTTFHGFCNNFLRKEGGRLGIPENFTVLDTEDARQILKEVCRELGISGRKVSLQDAWNYVDGRKSKSPETDYVKCLICPDSNELLKISARHLQQHQPMEAMFFRYLYRQRLAAALDFDDLIACTLVLLRAEEDLRLAWQQRLEYIEVDEFQDIDRQQYELAELLSALHGNLFVTGDPDQTIYSFRGANVHFFTDFEARHPGACSIIFKQNYRSQPCILQCAYTLISHNPDTGRVPLEAQRRDIDLNSMVAALTPALPQERDREEAEALKVLRGRLPSPPHKAPASLEEPPVRSLKPVLAYTESPSLEGEYIASEIELLRKQGVRSGIAVLYRIRHMSEKIEKALLRRRIPYRVSAGVEFLQRREIRVVMAYLRLCLNPADNEAFRRVVNEPHRGFGRRRQERLRQCAEASGQPLFYELQQRQGEREFSLAGVRFFLQEIKRIHVRMAGTFPPATALEEVLNTFQIEEKLRSSGEQERLESLAQLRQLASEFEADAGEQTNAADFILSLPLNSGERAMPDECVRLMTVHNSKGLEFDYVFVAGLNEGVFPSARAVNPGEVEEERRLLYVAMTRACRQLFLTRAAGRIAGSQFLNPSRFLGELKEDELLVRGHKPQLLKGALPGGVPAAAGRFAPGDLVFHEVFGKGKVQELHEQEQEYLIFFDVLKAARTLSFQAPLEPAEE